MDILTDFQQMQSNNEFMIPQTHEEHLLENIKNRQNMQNMRNPCYDLNISRANRNRGCTVFYCKKG